MREHDVISTMHPKTKTLSFAADTHERLQHLLRLQTLRLYLVLSAVCYLLRIASSASKTKRDS